AARVRHDVGVREPVAEIAGGRSSLDDQAGLGPAEGARIVLPGTEDAVRRSELGRVRSHAARACGRRAAEVEGGEELGVGWWAVVGEPARVGRRTGEAGALPTPAGPADAYRAGRRLVERQVDEGQGRRSEARIPGGEIHRAAAVLGDHAEDTRGEGAIDR